MFESGTALKMYGPEFGVSSP